MSSTNTSTNTSTNPLFQLPYEAAFALLGDQYSDVVKAAEFPSHRLRFRNDQLLRSPLGLDPSQVSEADWIAAFGQFDFADALPGHDLRAMSYHGYQFGSYNPMLGDGRGFLAAQVRGQDGQLYDFGTKGSGRTPYSRGGDGRLTLKGGVREIIATETLHRMGVRTSRTLSLIETGEQLYRGDEPSPTRSSVLVRFQRSHIRFGTFERLHYLDRFDLVPPLLDHVIEHYYPHYQGLSDRYARFYGELVQRVAQLVAQWMAAGFCHAVLNTDNMAITAESFDYGPFAFIPTLDPRFTAAYFDHGGRYAYANQPGICLWNLEMLQRPLVKAIAQADLDSALSPFAEAYQQAYRDCLLAKLGLNSALLNDGQPMAETDADASWGLIKLTLQLLQVSQTSYPGFFAQLRQEFAPHWWEDANAILAQGLRDGETGDDVQTLLSQWRSQYHRLLNQLPQTEIATMPERLAAVNPLVVPVRPEIEAIWELITLQDDWSGLDRLLAQIRA